jgi:hypothetical protein
MCKSMMMTSFMEKMMCEMNMDMNQCMTKMQECDDDINDEHEG